MKSAAGAEQRKFDNETGQLAHGLEMLFESLSGDGEPQAARENFNVKTLAGIDFVQVNFADAGESVLKETALCADVFLAGGNLQLVIVSMVADLRREGRK